jgi:signal transduction histidine kinase
MMVTMIDQSSGSPSGEVAYGLQSKGLRDHMQTISEQGKEKLARALHDDLGALLVGAMMDLAWAEQNWEKAPLEIHAKVTRARQSLAAAIDYKRQLVENLRPSLLENVGLFSALRWHVNAACRQTGFKCQIDIPDTELLLAPGAGISLFRIVQEAFALFCHVPTGTGKLIVGTDQASLNIQIIGHQISRPEKITNEPDYALTTIRQRVAALRGKSTLRNPSACAMTFKATVPLLNILSAAGAARAPE